MRTDFLAHGRSAFERLRDLLDGVAPGNGPDQAPVRLDLGEPRRQVPAFVRAALAANAGLLADYPANDGSQALLAAIRDWILRRYGVSVPTEGILALNGSREGLFSAPLALCRGGPGSRILMPDPAYQAYRAAALAVGAEPVPTPATRETGFMPDYGALPASVLNGVEAAYICSPANPQGAVAPAGYLRELLALAERWGFRVFADECYSELYDGDPPEGCLAVVAATGCDPERVVVFNSLSKRSGLPGLRSGFAAGGPQSVRRMRRLRAFGGAPVPGALQAVSALVWADEAHVEEARRDCREKYALAAAIFGDMPGFVAPQAGLFLWLDVGDGEAFAAKLWREEGVRVLPGAYLSGGNDVAASCARHVRIALTPGLDTLGPALARIRRARA